MHGNVQTSMSFSVPRYNYVLIKMGGREPRKQTKKPKQLRDNFQKEFLWLFNAENNLF
jgi:hypothetical protein